MEERRRTSARSWTAFLTQVEDTLVDLPADGSDLVSGFFSSRSTAHSVDIEACFKGTGDRLVILFAINHSRPSIVALDDAFSRSPRDVPDWIIIRYNHANAVERKSTILSTPDQN